MTAQQTIPLPPEVRGQVKIIDELSVDQWNVVNNLDPTVRKVMQWSQRQEPKRFTAIFQSKTTDGGIPDAGWRSVSMCQSDTVGIYLGNDLVLIVEGAK